MGKDGVRMGKMTKEEFVKKMTDQIKQRAKKQRQDIAAVEYDRYSRNMKVILLKKKVGIL